MQIDSNQWRVFVPISLLYLPPPLLLDVQSGKRFTEASPGNNCSLL